MLSLEVLTRRQRSSGLRCRLHIGSNQFEENVYQRTCCATQASLQRPPSPRDPRVKIAREGLGAKEIAEAARQLVEAASGGPIVGDEAEMYKTRALGTLRDADEAEPTVAEFHAEGSRYESPHAPIAPAFFPYNRCDVWACKACARPFLRYTEYGGYYEDQRIRAVSAALVEDASG